MIKAKDVIVVKQEVMLKVFHEAEFKAIITAVEENIFWIGLPRMEGQVLMLQKNQKLQVRIPLRYGFYSTETELAAIGDNYNRFYGLAMPEHLVKTQERQFVRAFHSNIVYFTSGNITAQTVLVNFSAGGVMVYLTPKLEKILQNSKNVTINFQINNTLFRLKARLAWRENYDNIPYAGFEFPYILPVMQKELDLLATKYARIVK